jgi:ketosteroid isomerase-like protein
MSQENLEIVKALQPPPGMDLALLFRDEATAAAAMEALASRFHDDFEVTVASALPPSRYAGLDGLRNAWLEWLEPWDSYRTEIEELIDVGDQVVVFTRDFGRRTGVEAEVSVLGAAVWTVRGGKLARADFYAHRDQALEAVGLSE